MSDFTDIIADLIREYDCALCQDPARYSLTFTCLLCNAWKSYTFCPQHYLFVSKPGAIYKFDHHIGDCNPESGEYMRLSMEEEL